MRDRCPRCGTELVDAGAARACTGCRGLWLGLGSLDEMVIQMQPTPARITLEMVAEERTPMACPQCSEPMRTVSLYGVAIDACGKRHGVWFDANELGALLLRSVAS